MRSSALICCSLALAGAVFGGCSSSSEPDLQREVTAQVQTAAGGVGMPNLSVTVWIVDVDQPGASRRPQALETRVTDGAGRASWQVQADGQPYVCGFRVESAAGQELLYAAPDLANRLSTGSGLTVISL